MAFTKTYSFFLSICFLLLLWGCHTPRHLVSADYQRYEINSDTLHTPTGNEISQLIAPYKSKLDDQMEMIIGSITHPLRKGKIESTLGNWTADAIAEYTEKATGRTVDLSICNYGGIRIPMIPAGPLKVGDIYELMPFDNYVVTMELTGKTLTKLLKQIADYGGWPVSSSLQMEIVNGKIDKALIHGNHISPQKTYFVVLSDYLADGGDRLDFLISLPRVNLGVFYRDALIAVAKSQKEITAKLEGRIKYIKH